MGEFFSLFLSLSLSLAFYSVSLSLLFSFSSNHQPRMCFLPPLQRVSEGVYLPTVTQPPSGVTALTDPVSFTTDDQSPASITRGAGAGGDPAGQRRRLGGGRGQGQGGPPFFVVCAGGGDYEPAGLRLDWGGSMVVLLFWGGLVRSSVGWLRASFFIFFFSCIQASL